MATHSSVLWRTPGQRSLEGYSPWDHKGLDTTERLTFLSLSNTNVRVVHVFSWLDSFFLTLDNSPLSEYTTVC